MENITKDILNSLLYKENGNNTEFHNNILSEIKPYLKKNIQLGGGINIIQEDDINQLFDDNGILKKQYGSGLKKKIKMYANVSSFNKFFSKYINVYNKFQPLADNIASFYEIIDKKTGNILSLLGMYYFHKKKLIQLKYILEKKNLPDDIINKETLKQNIRSHNNNIKGIIIRLNIAYKRFKKQFDNLGINLLKIKTVKTDNFSIINNNFNKLTRKIEKLDKYYNEKYTVLEQQIIEYRTEGKEIYTSLDKKFNTYKEYKIIIQNKINELALQISEINSIYTQITTKFTSYNEFDSSIGKMIEDELFNTYSKIEELIKISKKMSDNFEGMNSILSSLESAFTTFFDPELDDTNKFAIKIKEFNNKVHLCYLTSDKLFNQFIEINSAYGSIDFPPPNVNYDFDVASHNYKGIVHFFSEIQNVFSTFIQESTDTILIDNTTIIKFIKAIQGLSIGGKIQYGGVNNKIDNELYYLHTYDMYAVHTNNYSKTISGTSVQILKLTLTNLRSTSTVGIYNNVIYDTTPIPAELYYVNLPKGIIMVSNEIEYITNNNIIPKFVNDIKLVLNKIKASFIPLLYKGYIYIYN
jgi:hypothetical protein